MSQSLGMVCIGLQTVIEGVDASACLDAVREHQPDDNRLLA